MGGRVDARSNCVDNVAGRPIPKSKWTKNSQALPADDNLSLSQKPEMCKLQIQKARRSDAGEYDLELENASGKINVPITIKVIGKPSTSRNCSAVLQRYQK